MMVIGFLQPCRSSTTAHNPACHRHHQRTFRSYCISSEHCDYSLLQRVTVSPGHVVSLTGITKVVTVTVIAVILNVWEAAGGTLKMIRLHVMPAGTFTMKESVGVNVRRGMENSCWR